MGSMKKEYVFIPGVVHRYEEQIFIKERIIDGGPLVLSKEIGDEIYKDNYLLTFGGGKL